MSRRLLYILGDCHFSDLREWDEESFNLFIDWFSNTQFGEPGDEAYLLQLGDMTEKPVVDGTAQTLLARWAAAVVKKFKKTVIIGGNHCDKYDPSTGREHYSTSWLSIAYPDVIETVYHEQVCEPFIPGFKVLALPFRHTPESAATTIEEYYATSLPLDFYNEKVDLICGHVDASKIDLENKFNFKHAAFGHIHQRTGQLQRLYTGSIMPFTKGEVQTDLPRCMKVIDLDSNKELDEIQLPIFRTYVQLGSWKDEKERAKMTKKRRSGAPVTIYEFAEGDEVAMRFSTDFYVKKATSFATTAIQPFPTETTGPEQTVMVEPKSDLEYLDAMCADTGYQMKRKTKALLKQLFVGA